MGCQSTKNIPIKRQNSISYSLEIRERGDTIYIVSKQIKPLGGEHTIATIYNQKKGEKLFFDGDKLREEFKIIIDSNEKIKSRKYYVLKKYGELESLFGVVQVSEKKDKLSYRFFNRYRDDNEMQSILKSNNKNRFKIYDNYLKHIKKVYKFKPKKKQELTHSRDWLFVWNLCDKDIAFKKDGSIWEFKKIDCDEGQISTPYSIEIYHYYLKPKKIGVLQDNIKREEMVSKILAKDKIILKIKDIESGEIKTFDLGKYGKRVNRDGTLWLSPQIEYEKLKSSILFQKKR